MHQQINLYQPIFRAKRRIFSSRAIVIGIAIVAVSLIGLWSYGTWKVGRLEQEVATVARQDKARSANLASGSAVFAAQANPAEIESRIKIMSAELDRRARALDALKSGAAGTTEGFAARFEALARNHVEGLWLERIRFDGAGHGMSISGSTVNSRLVPRYLDGLQQEPALAGARFDHVEIAEPPATVDGPAFGPLKFRLSNTRIDRERLAEKPAERSIQRFPGGKT